MNTALGSQNVQPGSDHPIHDQKLQNNISTAVTSLTGQTTSAAEVTPAVQQAAVKSEISSEPRPETDWDDFYNGLKGRPRTDPSKNFLRTLLGRLRKKSPNKEVVSE